MLEAGNGKGNGAEHDITNINRKHQLLVNAIATSEAKLAQTGAARDAVFQELNAEPEYS